MCSCIFTVSLCTFIYCAAGELFIYTNLYNYDSYYINNPKYSTTNGEHHKVRRLMSEAEQEMLVQNLTTVHRLKVREHDTVH